MVYKINEQPAEGRVFREDGSLEVVSIFSTIQGEGPYSGVPAVFVRLAGCDLQCPRCDTNYTVGRTWYTVCELVGEIIEKGPATQLVVFTGGEPFRQNLKEALVALHDLDYVTQVETNGTLFPTGLPHTIVCSPKTSTVHGVMYTMANAWKYIVEDGKIDPDDGLPTSSLGMHQRPARPPSSFDRMRIYVQPLDTGDTDFNSSHVAAAVDVCNRFGYRLSLQQHKLLGLP
jgi:7-carboxy-7-deazaguanine synthase